MTDAYAKLVAASGAAVDQTSFPVKAKKGILRSLANSGDGAAPRKAVIGGFFYRDLNSDGRYNPGEELTATLLGLPTVDGAPPADTSHNSYWIGPLEAGRSYEVVFEPAGAEPFSATVATREGLNVLHLPIVPTQPLTYVVPHSHYDVEWVYSHEECLRRVELDQVRERLDLVQEEPAHVFCNDEECVTWPLVDRSDPEYREMLRRGILDGSIEPKGIVTQNELTMPYGEATIRVNSMGELMLSELIGETIRPETFWSIDQYGFGFQLPQILAKSGRKFLLLGEYIRDEFKAQLPHSNPETRSHSEFWLEGLDGSKVLVHRSNYGGWYYTKLSTGEPRHGPQYSPVLSHNTAFNFQGGDNCPPDRSLVETVRKLNEQDLPSKYIVALAPQFFRAVENDPELPTFSTECMTKYWNGIYESRYRGRVQNRSQENSLFAAEALATAASIEGMEYPARQIWDGWYLTLLNQHHDPLMCPMAVAGLWEAAIPIRNEAATAQIDAAIGATIGWLEADIATEEQPGTPVIVFNPSPWERSAVVEACLDGSPAVASVVDGQGQAVVSQVAGPCCGCSTVAFLATDLPALGWRTYYVSDDPSQIAEIAGVTATEDVIENEFVRVELTDGMIERILDKASGTAAMEAGPKAGVNEVFIWKDEGCISVIKPADDVGLVKFVDNPDAVLTGRSSEATDRTISIVESGPARGAVRVAYSLDWGTFAHTISLDANSRVVNIATDIDWDSSGKIADYNGRRVRVAFKSGYQQGDVTCDIPFGVIPWEQSEMIRPVNSWMEISGADSGVALMHFGNPSIQVVDDVVYMTLFRSIVEPGEGKRSPLCGWDSPQDEAREDGTHTIRYALYVHPGDWKAATTVRSAANANTPVLAKVAKRFTNFTGPLLPSETSYLSLSPKSLAVSAIKPTEYACGDVLVRVYNPTDEAVRGTLDVRFEHSSVEEVDFREELIEKIEGEGPYDLDFKPYEIKALRINLG